MRCAVVELASSLVLNVIIADPEIDPAPDGCVLIWIPPGTACSAGYYYDFANNTFVPPPEVLEEEGL